MEVLRFFVKIVLFVFMRVRIHGVQNVPEKDGAVIVANHESMLDMFMIGVRLKRYIKWMAKEELFKNKIVAKFITSWGAYPVKRNSKDLSAVRTTISLLEQGELIGMFPQGTRSRGRVLKPKYGAVKIAYESKKPIVPVALYGNFRIFGKVNVIFGKARYIPDPPEGTEYTKADFQNMAENLFDEIYGMMEDKIGNN